MRLIHVAAATLGQTPLDWDGNFARIASAIEAAHERGATVLCLPELAITGYGCEDAFRSTDVRRRALAQLARIVPLTRDLIVCVGLPLSHDGLIYNVAALLVDGRLAGFVAKRTLAASGVHYEPRWFRAWPAGVQDVLRLDDVERSFGQVEYAIGDLSFDVGGVRFGFEICEDAWGADRPAHDLAQAGVDVILNPSASHFAFGKHAVRERLVVDASRAFGLTYVYANLVGNEAGRIVYDGGALIASAGRLVAAGRRFGFATAAVTSSVVDLDLTHMARAAIGDLALQNADSPDSTVSVPFSWPEIDPLPATDDREAWERGPHGRFEEFTRAEALGLFDYMRKGRAGGYVVSLSGGADSAAVATLVALTIRMAGQELGLPAALARIGLNGSGRRAATERDAVHALLTTVYQSTRNSSRETREAARTVASALGARHHELDVDAINEAYVALVAEATGHELTWDQHDVALQNIQARVRAPSAWLLANLRNAVLLATSNRSEAAVGYATMDGDTAGGLSPIAGIDKAFLRDWLAWMQTTGPDGIGPIPELEVVTALAPTAELRPLDAQQTDERDLMPYDVLDAIEGAAIRDLRSPADVLRIVESEFPHYGNRQLAAWVELFFRLWTRNQWKRERYAPSFHLDDRNLDPRTWCRFPILSGGFQTELTELRASAGRAP